jgi:hypothetical protein
MVCASTPAAITTRGASSSDGEIFRPHLLEKGLREIVPRCVALVVGRRTRERLRHLLNGPWFASDSVEYAIKMTPPGLWEN